MISPFFMCKHGLKFPVISEPFYRASVTSHMKATGTRFSSIFSRFSTFSLTCLLAFLIGCTSCKSQSSLVKQSHHKTTPVVVDVIQSVPMLVDEPADQVEPATKTSLALASDADSGSGFAIALSGDELVSGSTGK